ncbi:MAG: hypothetical protein KGV59_06215 [Tenacibaculum sp.]|nr:hypothetical protein [Tenacibaculum sp.]
MASYRCSDGSRLEQKQIDKLIRKAKKIKVQNQFDEFGYNFCEECGISNGTFLDCSHDISVKKCKENGKTEQAFNVGNITIRCRECHQKHDKL